MSFSYFHVIYLRENVNKINEKHYSFSRLTDQGQGLENIFI